MYIQKPLSYIENFQQHAFQLLSNHHFESNFHSSRTRTTRFYHISQRISKAYTEQKVISLAHTIKETPKPMIIGSVRPKHLCVLHIVCYVILSFLNTLRVLLSIPQLISFQEERADRSFVFLESHTLYWNIGGWRVRRS